jgi:hypothetical protein
MPIPAHAFTHTALAAIRAGAVFHYAGEWFLRTEIQDAAQVKAVQLTGRLAGRSVNANAGAGVLTAADGWSIVPMVHDMESFDTEGTTPGALAMTPVGPAVWGTGGPGKEIFISWSDGKRLDGQPWADYADGIRSQAWTAHLINADSGFAPVKLFSVDVSPEDVEDEGEDD